MIALKLILEGLGLGFLLYLICAIGIRNGAIGILDFTLTDEEMAGIAKLDKGVRYYHRTEEQLIQFAGWKPAFEQK